MRKLVYLCVTIVILLIMFSCQAKNQTDKLTISSPDKNILVTFTLNQEKQPTYSVSYNGEVLIKPSKLGFTFKNDTPLAKNLRIVDYKESTFYDKWQTVWGIKKEYINHYNELIVSLEETNTKAPRKMDIIFRVFNDGVGFRYVLPEQNNMDKIEIMSEFTEFTFTDDHTVWWAENDWNSLEKLYQKTPLSQVTTANTPLTIKTTSNLYVALHEAQLINYASMALKQGVENYKLVSELAPWPDGVKVKGSVPLQTPWRTIQISTTPGGLIESGLILNLNDPCVIEDTSWIKPMKYMGIWWEMHIGKSTWGSGSNHGATTENALRYLNFIASHFDTSKEPIGFLVEGWNKGWDGAWYDNGHLFSFTEAYPDFDLEMIVQYAKALGIEYIMHNETSGDILNYERQMTDAFKYYQQLGVHMVKTGYVADTGMKNPKGQNHHGQYMVNHYNNVVQKAANYQLMINTHEPVKGTGLERTYPNWVSRESIRGTEYEAWSEGNPPEHTTILPFTMGLAGPFDYTPGIFDVLLPDRPDNCVHTTRAKQLALYVVLYSPIQMVSDLPENYLDNYGELLPEFKFIRDVPTTWDDTFVPHGEIGDYITVVRKKDNEFYIGSITDEEARELTLPLDFLDSDKEYIAEIYADSNDVEWETNPNGVTISIVKVTNKDTLTLSLAKGGGEAIRIYPAKNASYSAYQKPDFVVSYRNMPLTLKSNDPLEITLSLTNTGNVIKGETMNLYVNDKLVDSQTFRLNPKSSEQVTLKYENLFFEVGKYKIRINDLEEKEVTVNPKEATFVYNDLTINIIDNTLYVTASVTNTGTYPGNTKVPLIINKQVIEEKDLYLPSKLGGYKSNVTFTYQLPKEGFYEITVGDLSPILISHPEIDLSLWKFQKGDDLTYKEIDYDDSAWQIVTLPASWEETSNYYEDYVFGWYRKAIYLPPELSGYSIRITLGKIDDCDETYFNGYLIGKSGTIPDDRNGMISAWQTVRTYTIPAHLIKLGQVNVIGIRVYDATGGGGLFEGPLKIEFIKEN